MGILTLTCINVLCFLCVAHVIQAQDFAINPNTQQCTEGQECFFICAVKNLNSDSQEPRWQRNNILVTSLNKGSDKKYVEEINIIATTKLIQNTLTIKSIEREDAAYFYRCVTVIGGKNVYSNNGTIQVAEIPPSHFPLCSAQQTYSVGENAKLTCTSEETKNSNVMLQWFQNKVRITESIQNRKTDRKIISELTVQITAADKGSIYVCHQVLDILKEVNRSCMIGPLDITFGPIVVISGPRSIPLNGEALYVCSNTANPPTTLNEWIHPDLPSEAYSLENHKQVLRILKASRNMNGTLIRCIAVNSVNRVEKTFMLVVNSDTDRPVQTSKPNLSMDSPEVPPDVSKILSVAGMCLLITAVLIGLLLCYLQFCKFGLFPVHTAEERIAQPEVYFEPKDNIRCMMSPYDDNGMYYKRNVAVQVTPGVDTDSVYAEVEEGKKT